jgi:hypothetical protein
MTIENVGERVATAGDVPARPKILHASRVLIGAGLLGAIGQLLFFDVGLGINFPVAITLLVAGGWIVRRQPRLPALDAWLGPAAIGFAAFAAVRSDPSLVALDVLTALALAGGALASYGGRMVVSRSFGGLLGLAASAIGWGAAGAIPAIADARVVVPSRRSVARATSPMLPVVRGMLIAIPVLLVFVALFASADAVFSRLMDDLFRFDVEIGDVGWRVVLAIALAWLTAGGLAFAAVASEPRAEAPPTSTRLVGTTELVTILVSVNLVFAVFVALQGAYLFGGLDTLATTGMTYAAYARRGFFELVVVAILAGGLIIAAEQLARHRSRLLIVAAVALAIQTGAVLVSAALRLRLYQEAYGWTELRLYVLSTIIVLGVALLALVVAVATDRVPWMGHVLIVAGLAAGIVLNLIGPVRFITEQNVARVVDPGLVPPNGRSGLDVDYASSLGDDAVPALIRALPALGTDARQQLGEQLRFRLDEMRRDPQLDAWQSWNAGRSAARQALEDASAAGTLP